MTIEKVGIYHDFKYIVAFSTLSRVGYIRITNPSIISILTAYDYRFYHIPHGDVTFFSEIEGEKGKWIGFDFLHAGDKLDIDSIRKYKNYAGESFDEEKLGLTSALFGNGKLWSTSDVENECKRVIDELLKKLAEFELE